MSLVDLLLLVSLLVPLVLFVRGVYYSLQSDLIKRRECLKFTASGIFVLAIQGLLILLFYRDHLTYGSINYLWFAVQFFLVLGAVYYWIYRRGVSRI